MKYPTVKPGDLPRDQLILAYMPVVRDLAFTRWVLGSNILDFEDLISAGTIGLCKAVDRYDPSYNVLFLTYAEYRIRGEMVDEIRRMDMATRHQRIKINKDPTKHQDYVSILLGHRQVSDHTPIDPLDIIFRKELHKKLERSLVQLPKTHRTVLRMYFFKEISLLRIGKKLGFSESRASQIKTEGLKLLKDILVQIP
jgi:RNA polymerase sigma factor for flagellar operon FliA